MTATTAARRPISPNSIPARDRIAGWIDPNPSNGVGLAPEDAPAAAREILVSCSFADPDASVEIVDVLRRIAELDDDSDELATYGVPAFVAAVARAAFRGYSLPTNAARVAGILDAYDRLVEVEWTSDRAAIIGTVTITEAYEETVDHGTAWPTRYAVPAQTVPVYASSSPGKLAARRGGTFDRVSVSLEAVELWHETDVTRRRVEPATPAAAATSRELSTYHYVAAREIATTGTLFGGDLVLARGVRLALSPYTYRGADPRSTSWTIELDAEVSA